MSPSDYVSVILVDPGGMLPWSDFAGMLFPAVPAGIPFPVGPVGPCGTQSPSDSGSVGPDGPYGTLSPFESGSVGPCGTLSPSDSESAILMDPGGVFPSSDLARMRGPAPPAESAFLMGPVGPAMPLGVLPRLALCRPIL